MEQQSPKQVRPHPDRRKEACSDLIDQGVAEQFEERESIAPMKTTRPLPKLGRGLDHFGV